MIIFSGLVDMLTCWQLQLGEDLLGVKKTHPNLMHTSLTLFMSSFGQTYDLRWSAKVFQGHVKWQLEFHGLFLEILKKGPLQNPSAFFPYKY